MFDEKLWKNISSKLKILSTLLCTLLSAKYIKYVNDVNETIEKKLSIKIYEKILSIKKKTEIKEEIQKYFGNENVKQLVKCVL